ncbi:permease [Chakrabartyella piscis]|uniref:permease n=1 Tax=Chakrabartyella piscis TaxID=2918914 RepID=UPI00295833F8|nr:permease [Chakrabartyella piscis]
MFTYIIYIIAICGLMVSWLKDKSKTKMALRKAWKTFEGIFPQLITVLMIIGVMLTLVDESVISSWLGSDSSGIGVILAAILGSITLIPGFVAFPLAASLLEMGAGYMQITMFLTTLMMVGIITFPVESKYFGKKITMKRNVFAFCFAVCISLVIGGVF